MNRLPEQFAEQPVICMKLCQEFGVISRARQAETIKNGFKLDTWPIPKPVHIVRCIFAIGGRGHFHGHSEEWRRSRGYHCFRCF